MSIPFETTGRERDGVCGMSVRIDVATQDGLVAEHEGQPLSCGTWNAVERLTPPKEPPMAVAQQMLATHPQGRSASPDLERCIQACFECAQACTACADACLAEPSVSELVRCIRLNLDCADVCETTGRMLSRLTEAVASVQRAELEACAEACRVCAEECDRHAAMGMEHCRVCAEACRRCEEACRSMLGSLAA
jgi:Domain of Unknown Function (DUF326)